MPLRLLLRFLNNQQVVEQLANTAIIRRFAQLTHYSYIKLSSWSNQVLHKMAEEKTSNEQINGKPKGFAGRLVSFSRTFLQNIQKEIETSQKEKKGPFN